MERHMTRLYCREPHWPCGRPIRFEIADSTCMQKIAHMCNSEQSVAKAMTADLIRLTLEASATALGV